MRQSVRRISESDGENCSASSPITNIISSLQITRRIIDIDKLLEGLQHVQTYSKRNA